MISNKVYEGSGYDALSFWRSLSGLSGGTLNDHMHEALRILGYTGSLGEQIYAIGKNFFGSDSLTASDFDYLFRQKKRMYTTLLKGGTFYKDYTKGNSVDANFAGGSISGTFTATRSDSAPATYVDSSGNIQLVTSSNTPRFVGGFYDNTGFRSVSGLLLENSSTNMLKDTYFSNALAAPYWAAAAGTGGTGAISMSSDYTNPFAGGQVLKFVGSKIGDRFYNNDASGKDNKYTVSVGDVVTVSYLLRGSGLVRLYMYEGNGSTTQLDSSDITLTSSWTLFKLTKTITIAGSNAGCGIRLTADNGVVCYVAYMQSEKNKYGTSFIPTTTAALTRGEEKLVYAIASNRTKAQESFFIKVVPTDTTYTSISRRLADTETKQRMINYTGGDGTTQAYGNYTDNSTIYALATMNRTVGKPLVAAAVCAHATNPDPTVLLYEDGFLVNSDTTHGDWTDPNWGTSFSIGCSVGTAGRVINAIIQEVFIANSALSAADVADISLEMNHVTYTEYVKTDYTIYTVETANAALDALLSLKLPNWEGVVFGQSAQGRDIRGVVISPPGYTKTFYINAGLHGDIAERIATKAVIEFLKYLAANASIAPTVRWVILPSANPDGIAGLTRKNNNTAESRAVDLNRNFTEGWGQPFTLGAWSTNPTSDYYIGPSAASEPETVVLEGIISTYDPDFHMDWHCPDNAIHDTTGQDGAIALAINSYLTAQGHEPYPTLNGAAAAGQYINIAYAAGAWAAVMELRQTDPPKEVNRCIASILACLPFV